jgi:hypothetical protein
MNKSPSLAPSQESGGSLRHAAVGTLVALSRFVPNVLHLRRNPRSWVLFRFLLGIAGAALVVFPLGLSNNYYYPVAGLVMFVAAILLPPAVPAISLEEKARELGALVVVDGGRLLSAGSPSTAVHFFVGTECIRALDKHFQPVLTVPVNELQSVLAENHDGHWILRITLSDRVVQCTYRGLFGEHLAHTAETALRSVMAPSLPIPKRRAANA